MSHGNSTEYHSKRLVEISAEFSLEERLELAKLIIRKYDIFYEFHCNVKNCSSGEHMMILTQHVEFVNRLSLIIIYL